MSDYVLEVRNLHTSFFTDNGEVRAVNGISMVLEAGKTLGIVGESGSGKSVTAYSIMRILADTGRITEGEILDAIHRPLGARSLDGVKRRTRAGMGRCQAGFCSPRTMEIINRELGLPYEKITKSGGKSNIILERTKGEVSHS